MKSIRDIEEQARVEVAQELFRADVDAAKERIYRRRAGHRWWHRFIPFTIRIVWRQ